MKHANIPVFIPHLGCPNDCVFCNQRRISGVNSFDLCSVDQIIENALSTIDKNTTECEIAFFGGSFTGIPREDMIFLLELAYKYVERGDVKSIRLSTRPDYINEEILDILKKYRVTDIELGLQSMVDKVLFKAKRGHNAKTAENACRLIKDYGFSLVGQMMIGLPQSTLEDEIFTARYIAENCDQARVYPTVVFADTALCDMMKEGEYFPLTLEDCITRTGEVLCIFDEYGKKVIRIGLQSSDNLFDEKSVVGGSYHSAIGELAENYLFYKKIAGMIAKQNAETNGKTLTVYVPKGCISKAVGQKKANKEKLINNFNFNCVKVVEKTDLSGYNVLLNIN